MSYFNGLIPAACRECFSFDGTKWVQNTPRLCDECDFASEMFPVLTPRGRLDHKQWALLEEGTQPDGRI